GVARVTGVHGDAVFTQAAGVGDGEHAVGLFGLAVGGVVVVRPAAKLDVTQIEAARIVAGHVHDARAVRTRQRWLASLHHPMVTEHVGGPLALDALGGFFTVVGAFGGVVDEYVDGSRQALGEGDDLRAAAEVADLDRDVAV